MKLLKTTYREKNIFKKYANEPNQPNDTSAFSPLPEWPDLAERPVMHFDAEDVQASIGKVREQSLGASTGHDFDGVQNMVCVTLYNEELPCLKATLRAIAASVHHAGSVKTCVCLVVDGVQSMDPMVLAHLQKEGMVLPIDVDDEGISIHLFFSLQPLGKLLGEKHPDSAVNGKSLPVVVCIKRQNIGKLHSHAVFFSVVCQKIQPAYCIQVDTGTLIAPSALQALCKYFDSQPDVGGIGTHVRFPQPGPDASMLERWQYMDWAAQLAIYHPAELSAGHLSVIPGPFCAFRWLAIAPEGKISSSGPLARYLRGLSPQSTMEQVMFLAEDRVIGNEIVLARDQSWRLDHCEDAQGVTDACDNLDELLRQRRRWNNSALACRLWFVGQWPRFMLRSDRSIFDKLRFSVSTFFQLLFGLAQTVMLVNTLALMMLMTVATRMTLQDDDAWLAWTFLCSLALLVSLLLWTPSAAQTKSQARQPARLGRGIRCLSRDATALVCVASLVGTALQAFSSTAVVFVFGQLMVMALLPAITAPAGRFKALKLAPEFMLTNIFIEPFIFLYALFKLRDLSWGTKGLKSMIKGSLTHTNGRYFSQVMLGMLGLNVVAFLYMTQSTGLWARSLNIFLEFRFGFMWCIVLLAALTTLRRQRYKCRDETLQIRPRLI